MLELQIVIVFVGLVVLYALLGIRFVRNDRAGIVEKRFGGSGTHHGLIALGNEPGFRPDVLRGGLYWLAPIVFGTSSTVAKRRFK